MGIEIKRRFVDETVVCIFCNGTGGYTKWVGTQRAGQYSPVPCDNCDGLGKYDRIALEEV